MTWSDIKWYEVIWSDMKWYEVIWSDMKWYEVIWSDMKWYEVIWSDMKWYEVIRLSKSQKAPEGCGRSSSSNLEKSYEESRKTSDVEVCIYKLYDSYYSLFLSFHHDCKCLFKHFILS